MIWLTWRQHRLQLLSGAGLLALLSAFFLATGPGMASAFRHTGLAACLAASSRDCGDLAGRFEDSYANLRFLIPLSLALPALIGVFWGAPLIAREVEQGTHRLAWTQGVTRMRWLGVKLAALIGATVLGAAAFTWALSWWSRPLVAAGDDRFSPGVFDLRGVVPIAYALFALALGVAVGAIVRRIVPAMAASLTAFVVIRAEVALWLRPHYAAAKTMAFSMFTPSGGPGFGRGDWVLSAKTVDGAGRFMGNGIVFNLNVLGLRCPGLSPSEGELPNPGALQACARRVGLHAVARFQPGSRYWMFQGIESAIFVGLALGLLVLSVWWVRRRVS